MLVFGSSKNEMFVAQVKTKSFSFFHEKKFAMMILIALVLFFFKYFPFLSKQTNFNGHMCRILTLNADSRMTSGEMYQTPTAFLVCIFPHLDRIRRETDYLSIFSPNAGKYGPEKIRIRTPSATSFLQILI